MIFFFLFFVTDYVGMAIFDRLLRRMDYIVVEGDKRKTGQQRGITKDSGDRSLEKRL